MTEVLFRVLDTETTGLEPPAELIEFGWADLTLDTETKACAISKPRSELFRPVNGIPPEVQAIHHISMDDLRDKAEIDDSEIADLLTAGAPMFLVAHNAKFDRQWITDDLVTAAGFVETPRWIDTFKCGRRLWPEAPGHGNQVLRYWLEVDVDRELAEPPHRAGPDAYVTAHVLQSMLQATSVAQLVAWTKMPLFYPTCPHAKFKGPWSEVESGYLAWMSRLPDIEPDLLIAVHEELDRRRAL